MCVTVRHDAQMIAGPTVRTCSPIVAALVVALLSACTGSSEPSAGASGTAAPGTRPSFQSVDTPALADNQPAACEMLVGTSRQVAARFPDLRVAGSRPLHSQLLTGPPGNESLLCLYPTTLADGSSFIVSFNPYLTFRTSPSERSSLLACQKPQLFVSGYLGLQSGPSRSSGKHTSAADRTSFNRLCSTWHL